jgi:hypothetical protein
MKLCQQSEADVRACEMFGDKTYLEQAMLVIVIGCDLR